MSAVDYAQRVYTYHRDYVAMHGYAPTTTEAYHQIGIGNRQYYAVLDWLLERRFLTREDRHWRGIRVNVRVCTCGAEITPENAVYTSASMGRQYARTLCIACWRVKNAAEQRERRQRVDNNAYMKAYRLRRHLRQREASA